MKTILNILLSILMFSSCVQAKQIIKNSYAYLLVTHAGMIAVDDNGNQRSNGVDTSHIIYIETPATATPQWDVAFLNNKAYSITASPISQQFVQIGFSQKDEQLIMIKPATGNKLWRINLGPIIKNRKTADSADKNKYSGTIILEGKMNNKTFTHIIKNEIVLRPIQGE